MKRFIACFLLAAFLLMSIGIAYAEDIPTGTEPAEAESNEKDLEAVQFNEELFKEMVAATLIRVDGKDEQGEIYTIFQALENKDESHRARGQLYEEKEGTTIAKFSPISKRSNRVQRMAQ